MTTVMHIQLIIQVEHQTKKHHRHWACEKIGYLNISSSWFWLDYHYYSMATPGSHCYLHSFYHTNWWWKAWKPTMNLSIIFLGKRRGRILWRPPPRWDQGCFKSQGKLGLLPFFRPIDSIDFSQFTTDPHESLEFSASNCGIFTMKPARWKGMSWAAHQCSMVVARQFLATKCVRNRWRIWSGSIYCHLMIFM